MDKSESNCPSLSLNYSLGQVCRSSDDVAQGLTVESFNKRNFLITASRKNKNSLSKYYYYYYYHNATGRKTRLDIQNYGCNGNILCYHGVMERNYISCITNKDQILMMHVTACTAV